MYIGAQLGRGPRDGLMTGLARRTGLVAPAGAHRASRSPSSSSGSLLGGIVGVGTVVYALLIGPVVQLFLPVLTVRVERPAARGFQTEPAVTEPAAG